MFHKELSNIAEGRPRKLRKQVEDVIVRENEHKIWLNVQPRQFCYLKVIALVTELHIDLIRSLGRSRERL